MEARAARTKNVVTAARGGRTSVFRRVSGRLANGLIFPHPHYNINIYLYDGMKC